MDPRVVPPHDLGRLVRVPAAGVAAKEQAALREKVWGEEERKEAVICMHGY